MPWKTKKKIAPKQVPSQPIEILSYFEPISITKTSEKITKLSPDDVPEAGELLLGLKYTEVKVVDGKSFGDLYVFFQEIRGLPNGNVLGPRNCFIKLVVFPLASSVDSIKVPNNLSPVYSDQIKITNMPLEELSNFVCLQLTVIDETKSGGHHIIGGLRLGSKRSSSTKACVWLDSNLLEHTHWEDTLSNPGQWVECCHALRPSREYMDIVTYKPSIFTELFIVDNSPSGTPLVNHENEGSISLGLCYEVVGLVEEKNAMGRLHVRIYKAENLPHAKVLGYSNCLVKLNLYPSDKSEQTKQTFNTLDPIWNEEIIFEGLMVEDLSWGAVLELTIVDLTMSGGTHIIGGLHMRPKDDTMTNELSSEVNQWQAMLSQPDTWVEANHKIKPKKEYMDLTEIEPSDLLATQKKDNLGEVVVSTMFKVTNEEEEAEGTLHVKIKEARNLKGRVYKGYLADCVLHPYLMTSQIDCTEICHNAANPTWEKTFIFQDMSMDFLSQFEIVKINLWGTNDGSTAGLIGRVYLGPKCASTSYLERKHWKSIFKNPGEWIEYAHKLKCL